MCVGKALVRASYRVYWAGPATPLTCGWAVEICGELPARDTSCPPAYPSRLTAEPRSTPRSARPRRDRRASRFSICNNACAFLQVTRLVDPTGIEPWGYKPWLGELQQK
jgi:hypothetical protein